MNNFSPFSVKIYTLAYLRFWGLQGGSTLLPKKNFEFCELNMHNVRPFLV